MPPRQKKTKLSPEVLLARRLKSGLSQKDFWNKYGATQSAGSRYENGEKLPKPLEALLLWKGTEEFDFKEISTKKIKDLRKRLGLDQYTFWKEVKVTQSGGSRYESGRRIPKPTRALIRLMYGEWAKL